MNHKIGGIIKNDFSAAPGVCVTVFVQGCPLHCPGCHNPELQDFNGGRKLNTEEINEALTANGLHRNLCIMGGEPLCYENKVTTSWIIASHIDDFKDNRSKIYVWTGFRYEDLKQDMEEDGNIQYILEKADYLIDGPYKQEERDITLCMRGSRNQRVIDLKTGKDVTNDFEHRARQIILGD